MTSPGRTWVLGRRPSLDALRGVAVLMVLLGHTLLPTYLGGMGVTIFFTLSGFLITSLVVQEHGATGTVSLRRFYARRARRLTPALAALLTVLGLNAFVHGGLGAWLPGGAMAALFLGNWAWAAGIELPGMAHTWSLALEEQFYLLWPLALIVLLPFGARRAALMTAVLVVVSVALTALTLSDYRLDAVSPPTRAKELLVGCLIALVCVHRGKDLTVPTVVAVAAAIILMAMTLSGAREVGLLAAWIPTAVILTWFVSHPSFLDWAPLVWTGRISFGLYLFHFPIAYGPFDLFAGLDVGPRAVAVIGTSYLVAAISWLLIERPVLEGRRHRSTRTDSDAEAVIGRPRAQSPRSVPTDLASLSRPGGGT